MRLALLFPFAAAFLAALATAGCQRPCETADNCKRTCDCIDSTTESRLQCTMAFRCESADLVCESDYDALACVDVCGQYAAIGKCGFQRCSNNAECAKKITCPVLNAEGQPTSLNFTCDLTFACDQELQLCQAGSELPQDQLCRACPVPP